MNRKSVCMTQNIPSIIGRRLGASPPEHRAAGVSVECPSPRARAAAAAQWHPPCGPCAPSSSAAAPPHPATAAPLHQHRRYSLKPPIHSPGMQTWGKAPDEESKGEKFAGCPPSSAATTRAKMAATVLATMTLSASLRAA